MESLADSPDVRGIEIGVVGVKLPVDARDNFALDRHQMCPVEQRDDDNGVADEGERSTRHPVLG